MEQAPLTKRIKLYVLGIIRAFKGQNHPLPKLEPETWYNVTDPAQRKLYHFYIQKNGSIREDKLPTDI